MHYSNANSFFWYAIIRKMIAIGDKIIIEVKTPIKANILLNSVLFNI
ncbi:Hypothetical protein MCYN_0069 [Mycoplasmopsis cynos C142]|uniref:Uncharacterized protein n=1 Tax=Mycoplasmopsis cynos (strain C142) TaxID=1246955 RepID=L0RVZ9_MYCC1|nr:Hypothetical protein MCYN_0069 [Mycoplasmopsis cynos C142]